MGKRVGLRCPTVRVGDREVRRLISNGYLSLESSKVKAAVAIALEAWIGDNHNWRQSHMSQSRMENRCARSGYGR
jgi:hypothetical protein